MTGFFAGALAVLQATGYLANQGWHQARLLSRRVPVAEVVAEGKESPARLEKLRLLPAVKAYAESHLNLVPGKSYEKYVRLDGESVTWIVQAAPRRKLALKTWWFPVVGSQPYLGFFEKGDAKSFQEKLKAEGYDTTLGGVQAFSMLGYLSDPLYSSMLDGNEVPDFVDVVLHESVHATIYLANFSAFNENLANFVALKGTLAFFRDNPTVAGDVEAFRVRSERSLAARTKFRAYLLKARADLETFYARAKEDPALASEAAFLTERQGLFDRLSDGYKAHMAGAEVGTGYQWAFSPGRLNNAVLLGYSLYEAHFEPFEKAFAAANGDVARLVSNLKSCLQEKPSTEAELWSRVENCR